jgi:hypothetical protein
MNTLRGLIKRVTRREGRVGRVWLMNNEHARWVNRLSSSITSKIPHPAGTVCGLRLQEHGIDGNCAQF